MKFKIPILTLVWCGIVVALLWGVYQVQYHIDYQECYECDGRQYLNIYNKMSYRHSAKTPFNHRVFTPFIAHFVPTNYIPLKFYLIGGYFCILTIVSLVKSWKLLNFSPLQISIAFGLCLLHWSGFIRYYAFDPVSVDLEAIFFEALLLGVILSKRYKWLWLIGPLGFLTKESFLAYMIVTLLFMIIHNKLNYSHFEIKPILITLILILFAKIGVTYYSLPGPNESSPIVRVLYYCKEVLKDPLDIFRWIVAIFTAYGGLWLLSLMDIRKHFKSNPEMNLILVLSIVSILFGLIAGEDRTRIVFVGFPFIMTSILYQIRNRGKGVIIVAFLLSIPLMRIASNIPALNDSNYKNWYPEYADIWVVCAWFCYMVFCYFILKKVNGYFQDKTIQA